MIDDSDAKIHEKRSTKNIIDQIKNEIDKQLVDIVKHIDDADYCPEISFYGN